MKKELVRSVRKWWSDVRGTSLYLRYREKDDRGRRLAGQFLTIITIATGVYYLFWHWRHINWDIWYYSLLFFFAETIGFLLFCFFSINDWFLRFHAPEGISTERLYSVDVFIPVAGEPIELVEKTVKAATRIEYDDKRVYILDDKGDAKVRELAERCGCGYIARAEHSDAKAGNLNHALSQTGGELILALDADQVPEPQIINRVIGYFRLPRIGFVQTKQNFIVPVGDPFGNRDRIFYDVMQSGKDNDNSAFSCGSGVVYLRKALEEVGGFSTWNIVEDVHTSMLLHERGWRSIYHDYALTRGTAPADIRAVYRQRRQWAADSLRILFWDNPFSHKGLSLKQKLQYFNLGVVYLVSAFVMPFFFVTPIFALYSGNFVLMAPVSTYILHRFPYFIAMSLAYGVLNYPTSYMKAYQMWTGLFPVFIHATWVALRSRKKKPAYRVNAKTVAGTRQRIPLLAVSPQLAIIILAAIAIAYAFLAGPVTWDFFLLNFVWAIWAIWTMGGVCLSALSKLKWSEDEVREERVFGFSLGRTKELFVTVAFAAIVMFFFITVDPVKSDRLLTNLRLRIVNAVPVKDITERLDRKIPTVMKFLAPRSTGANGTASAEEEGIGH